MDGDLGTQITIDSLFRDSTRSKGDKYNVYKCRVREHIAGQSSLRSGNGEIVLHGKIDDIKSAEYYSNLYFKLDIKKIMVVKPKGKNEPDIKGNVLASGGPEIAIPDKSNKVRTLGGPDTGTSEIADNISDLDTSYVNKIDTIENMNIDGSYAKITGNYRFSETMEQPIGTTGKIKTYIKRGYESVFFMVNWQFPPNIKIWLVNLPSDE
jgi:hypothetical protein